MEKADTIVFELATRENADSLHQRLGLGWVAQSRETEGVWNVEADLRSGKDFARLLRTVERWVAERALGAIRFHVDARSYVLEAGEIAWPFAA